MTEEQSRLIEYLWNACTRAAGEKWCKIAGLIPITAGYYWDKLSENDQAALILALQIGHPAATVRKP